MANAESLQIDPSSWFTHLGRSQKSVFTAGGALTYPAGLVLGRITASGKLVPYASGASDGSGIPVAALIEEIEAGGAGDIDVWVMLEGASRYDATFVWHAGTPAADLTLAERDQLRSYGIDVKDVTSLNFYDNTIP